MFCPNHGLLVFLTYEATEVQLQESLLSQGPRPKVINTPCVAVLSIQGACVCRSYLILTMTLWGKYWNDHYNFTVMKRVTEDQPLTSGKTGLIPNPLYFKVQLVYSNLIRPSQASVEHGAAIYIDYQMSGAPWSCAVWAVLNPGTLMEKVCLYTAVISKTYDKLYAIHSGLAVNLSQIHYSTFKINIQN